MEVRIPFGKDTVSFEIPGRNLVGILAPNAVNIDCSPTELVRAALNNPTGASFPDVAGKRICIICEDGSRPLRMDGVLDVLVKEILNRGGRVEDIMIVMALGSHRPMTEEEIKWKVGARLSGQLKVANSEFRDKRRLKFLGSAPGNVPVWVDSKVADADVRIGVGTIVPHPAVGWSGGGKIIYPGVTGEETVSQFHLRHGRIPRNMFGEVDCPVRLEMEQWVDTVGLDFIVNVIATPNKDFYRVVAGHYVAAHRRGVAYARQVYEVVSPGLADIAIVSSFPADADFWQAGKGILAGESALKDGGTLVLVSPCFEGVGPHPEWVEACCARNPDQLLDAAVRAGTRDVLGLAVGATIGRIRKRIKIKMVTSGMTPEEVSSAGITHHYTIEEAIQTSLEDFGNDARIVVIPFGGETVIRVR